MIFPSPNVLGVVIILYVNIVYSNGMNKTTFIVMSQKPHTQIAANTKMKLHNSLKQSGTENPNIHLWLSLGIYILCSTQLFFGQIEN